jgi:undecaprenyl-diphosphatase
MFLLIQNLILGMVQGITEFLPVSSSGHLLILEKLFNIKESLVLLNLILHVGTVLAVICFL